MRPRGLPADDFCAACHDGGSWSIPCFNEAAGTTRG